MAHDETRGREHLVARQVAMVKALQELAVVWPSKFREAHISGVLPSWMFACEGTETALLVPAAREIVREARSNTFPPKPGDLADMTRRLAKRRDGATATAAPEHTPPDIETGKDGAAIDRLYAAAARYLRGRGHTRGIASPIGQLWAMLLEAQDSAEGEARVRAVDVTDVELQIAADAWLAGHRPRGHPMNNLGLSETDA